jgi:two-component sensor histidine kinase
MASDTASSLLVWPVAGGETGALIRAHVWSRTPLGDVGQWPERLRAAVDNCLDAAFASFVWWGPELIQFYNDPALAIVRAKHPNVFGMPAREAWSDVWTTMGPVVERIMGTGRPVLSERVLLATGQGEPRELTRLRFFYSALRDGAGAVAGIVVNAFETTERAHAEPAPCCRTSFEAMDGARAEAALAESEARMVLMVAELQHRTRNLIAVVRSIISHTLASSPSPDEFKLRIDHRLSALSRVQGLLSRAEQEPITIGLLVRTELDALGPDVRREQVDIAGPEVRLRSSMVQTLALALHELATNARKYGALSTEQGRLWIAWQLERRGNASWLMFRWIEENGRRAGAPPGPKGYGRELIEQALPYSHGAETRYELDETGLRCSIALPLGIDARQERRP